MTVISGLFLFVIIIILGVLTGVIVLQIYLSRLEGYWPGLLLPMLCFCAALVNAFGVLAQGVYTANIIRMTTTFMSGNIPTIIMLVIYLACREKQKRDRRRALERMNVQDL